MNDQKDATKTAVGQSLLTDGLDVVALLKAVQIGLAQVGLQDGYIDYNYSKIIQNRVDEAIKILTTNS